MGIDKWRPGFLLLGQNFNGYLNAFDGATAVFFFVRTIKINELSPQGISTRLGRVGRPDLDDQRLEGIEIIRVVSLSLLNKIQLALDLKVRRGIYLNFRKWPLRNLESFFDH